MESVTGFVGRTRDLDAAIDAIGRGANVLIRGRSGIGKSAFLRAVRERLADHPYPLLHVTDGTAKHVHDELARQLHEHVGLSIPRDILGPRLTAKAEKEGGLSWNRLARTLGRVPVSREREMIEAALKKRRFLAVIETLEVSPQIADTYALIVEHAQVIAGFNENNRRVRIERLLWRFQETVDLKPLTLEESAHIAESWLEEHPVRFADDATRRRFVRHVAQDSGGVPVAIRGMLESAQKVPEITPAMARGFTHPAGIRYVDMTPALILALIGMMMLRYISRGLGEIEWMVMSGVSAALFWGIRIMLMSMRNRR